MAPGARTATSEAVRDPVACMATPNCGWCAHRQRCVTGFAGTTWRKQANVIWMMNGGVMIITASVMLVFVVQGAFLLIPMTMAYFFTYVLGPINDMFYQRPLLCGPTCCHDEKTEDWQDEHGVWHEGEKPKRSCCKVGLSTSQLQLQFNPTLNLAPPARNLARMGR